MPRLTADTRYLIFLTNVDWFYTPIVGNYIFRLERGPQGTDILIDPSGHAVIGVTAAGLQLTQDPVVEDELDFLTPHAKPKLLDSKRSQLVGAMSKEAFLFDDGQNDAVVVKRSDIGGNNGLTSLIHDGCFIAGDMEWLEADVQVASDMSFATLAETSVAPNQGRETFIHEFGHAHGLNHAQGYNQMRAPGPRPRVGGPGETVDVLPDDAQGGRFLYPSGINLFASAQRRDIGTDTIVNNASGTVFSCTGGGGTLTINSTVGNNGTVNVTQTERWWLNKSSAGHSGGILLTQWNNSTFVANTAFTRLITWTMPPLAAGTYFLFHGVDVFNVAAESRENDNNVREALVVEVIPCS